MHELERGRRIMSRLGIVVLAVTALTAVLVLGVPGTRDAFALLVLGGFAALGVGLVLGARIARVAAGLLALAGLVFAPISLIEALTEGRSPLGLPSVLAAINAVATTALMMWLSLAALLVMLGRSRPPSIVTPRLLGGVLVLVAVQNLWLATQVGIGWTGAWSINISPRGTTLAGFPGWPLWHLAVLVPALLLLAAPRRLFVPAATALLAASVALVVLVITAVVLSEQFEAAFVAFMLGLVSLPVFLAWWFRDELRSDREAGGVAGGGDALDHGVRG